MPKQQQLSVKWLEDATKADYKAAASYLELLFPRRRVNKWLKALRASTCVKFQAKDVFRASRLPLLEVSNSHVEKVRKEILSGKGISPILLVRDPANGGVIVADGYHRICAIYGFDENAVIRSKIL